MKSHVNSDLLDDPNDDRYSIPNDDGEGQVINRYRVSFPSQDELLFSQLKSRNIGSIFGLLLFSVLGGFFIYLFFHFVNTEGYKHGMLVLLFLAFIAGIVPVVIIIFNSFVSKRQFLFTKEAYIKRGFFKTKPVCRRENVTSVFIKVTINTRNGFEQSRGYALHLRVHQSVDKNLDLYLFDVEYILPWFSGGLEARDNTEFDGRQLAKAIADHWGIPVSV